MVVSMEADAKIAMGKLKKAMAEAANGKQIKREVSKELRGLMKPLETEMRQRVLRLPSKGHSGTSMRSAIAKQTRAATRWSGPNMGVSVVQKARGMPRGFRFAGRVFNRVDGWNPTTLGGVVEHQEIKPAKWFDGATPGIRPEAVRAMHEALEAAAVKIGASAK